MKRWGRFGDLFEGARLKATVDAIVGHRDKVTEHPAWMVYTVIAESRDAAAFEGRVHRAYK